MLQEKYSMKCHTYPHHLKDMLQDMMSSDTFTDVTLVCDDQKQIKAHKVILSAFSSVFKNIFTQNNLPMIYLRGVDSSEMESIIQFIYLGETAFYQERLELFLMVAKDLDIKLVSKDDRAKPVNDEHLEKGFSISTDNTHKNDPDNTVYNNEEITNEEEIEQTTTCYENNKSTNNVVEDKTDQITNYYEATNHATEPKQEPAINDNYEIIREAGHKPMSLKNISLCLNSKGYYECTQCEKQFKASIGLSKHFESIHVGVKYKCKKCEKEFAWKAAMNRHIRTKHLGFRYICAYCDFKAPRLDNLKNHTKNEHSGQTADYLFEKCSK